jgi:tetratricopeptide (TPR) repeat protein
MEMLHKALSIRRRLLGSMHRDVSTVLNNIGRIHFLRNEFEDALVKVYQEALYIQRNTLGPTNHIDIAAIIYNTGQTHHHLGQLESAMELYNEFLVLAKVQLGNEHRDMAIMYKCVAQVYQERGELSDAKKMFELAFKTGLADLGQ